MNTVTPTPTEPSPFAAPPSAPQPAPPPPAQGTRAKLVPLLLAATMGWTGSFLFSRIHPAGPDPKAEAITSPVGAKAASTKTTTKEAPKAMTPAKQEPPAAPPTTTVAASTKPVASPATAPANPTSTAAVVPQTPPPLPPPLEPAGSVSPPPSVKSTPLHGGSNGPHLASVGVQSPVLPAPTVDERALAREMFKKNLDTLRILGK